MPMICRVNTLDEFSALSGVSRFVDDGTSKSVLFVMAACWRALLAATALSVRAPRPVSVCLSVCLSVCVCVCVYVCVGAFTFKEKRIQSCRP
jgi:hypothetical protein